MRAMWGNEISGQEDDTRSNADVGLGRNSRPAGESCVCWYRHVLRKDKNKFREGHSILEY